MKNKILFPVLTILVLILSACSFPMTGNVVKVKDTGNSPLVPYLVDTNGKTLYIYTKDTPNTSNCYGACAVTWPPLLTSVVPVAGSDLKASFLDRTQRTDGSLEQITYNGWPLYYYSGDNAAGDTNGENINEAWFVISPDGVKR